MEIMKKVSFLRVFCCFKNLTGNREHYKFATTFEKPRTN
jgi:hypothetical protein